MNAHFLRKWDKSNVQQKMQMLHGFYDTYKLYTYRELEKILGPSCELFFTRFTTLLRLTYVYLGNNLPVQLGVIQLFISGQKPFFYFLEIGGIETLLDILIEINNSRVDAGSGAPEVHSTNDEAQMLCLNILNRIAECGRKYKEMICEDGGMDRLFSVVSSNHTDKCIHACTKLLLTLCRGNPTQFPALRKSLLWLIQDASSEGALIACYVFREIYQDDAKRLWKEFVSERGVIDKLFKHLAAMSMRLRFESSELLCLCVTSSPESRNVVVTKLLESLTSTEEPATANKLTGTSRLIGSLVRKTPDLLATLLTNKIHMMLIDCASEVIITNTSSFYVESMREVANTLRKILMYFKENYIVKADVTRVFGNDIVSMLSSEKEGSGVDDDYLATPTHNATTHMGSRFSVSFLVAFKEAIIKYKNLQTEKEKQAAAKNKSNQREDLFRPNIAVKKTASPATATQNTTSSSLNFYYDDDEESPRLDLLKPPPPQPSSTTQSTRRRSVLDKFASKSLEEIHTLLEQKIDLLADINASDDDPL